MIGASVRALRKDRFARRLALLTVAGLVVRLVYVLVFRRDDPLWGDATFYHDGANLLVDGKGFIAPVQYAFFGEHVHAADHPPAYLVFLASASLVGFDTPLSHLVWSALLGSGTVVAVGLLGRRVASDRAGLVAAALAAFLPNIWVYDGELLSETLAILLSTVAVLLAYRVLEERSTARICWLGVVCGACAMTRSELVLLVPALLIPVAWKHALPGVLVAVAVMTPWVVYNLTRFDHPVLLSSQLEATLAGANCDQTYYGAGLGLIANCLGEFDLHEDQSVTARTLRRRAFDYIGDHKSRVPAVVAARVARVAGVYRPAQQVDVDVALERRERPVAIAILVAWYAMVPCAIAGGIVLGRRRRTWWPLVVLPALSFLTIAATYGTNRFRATAETSVLVLAAVALTAMWDRARSPG